MMICTIVFFSARHLKNFTTDTVNLSIIIVFTIKSTSGKTLEIKNIGFHYEQCFWRKRFIPSHSEMRKYRC